ncbi:MAG: tetratricopeptide repeat protein [Promethearchaeia archaeon]
MTKDAEVIEEVLELRENAEYKKAYQKISKLYEQNKKSSEVKQTYIDTLFAYAFYLSDDCVLQFEKAAECLKEILQLDPENYRAYYNLGITYYDMDKTEKALKMYNEALKLKPDNKYVHYNIGIIYEDKNQFKKALKYYRRAINLDKDFLYAKQAKHSLERYIENNPESIKSERHPEKLKRLKSLFRVSNKVRLDDIQEIINFSREKTLDLVVDWAEDYGLHINGDFLVLNERSKSAFLKNLEI